MSHGRYEKRSGHGALVDKSKVRTAIHAVVAAMRALRGGRSPFDDDEGALGVYNDLTKTLARSLGNVGHSADFVNAAFPLSTGRDLSRHGRAIPRKGMLYLFEEDGPGEFSILRMADDDGNIADGSLLRILRRLK
jgi:hypothetical protein